MIITKNKKEYFNRLLIQAKKSRTKQALSILTAAWLDTKLGPMLAIADDQKLFLLEFVERIGLEREIKRLKEKTKSKIVLGFTQPINIIKNELGLYFQGKLKTFKTPTKLLGTSFQKQVWQELIKIPYGQLRSYTDLAEAISNPTAYRAIARANATNQLAIIIPCHRVIQKNGQLCGYAAGQDRKKWFINHEKKNDMNTLMY